MEAGIMISTQLNGKNRRLVKKILLDKPVWEQ